ncbi:hypothetical protein MLD38_038209 [Melastoma candidum]|uniref:Uncharacterized protein n=1 Tax=Melastoma candidum TaxID=119954 RepID=A0ACB9KY90_9MYRT|nr:hypothetical protein MLD38_038209 [Melastoma candidum]
MQGGAGFNSVPSTVPLDKSRVLDVKPLRSLKPIFSTSHEAPPYVCATPDGPFPLGFSPFYPFNTPPSPPPPPEPVRSVADPAPIRSFRTPGTESNGLGTMNRDASSGGRRRPGRPRSGRSDRKAKKYHIVAPLADYVAPISSSQREDGSKEAVDLVMRHFDGLRRRLSQLDDSKEVPSGLARRSDLRAVNLMMSKGFRTNMRKRVGAVPGIEIGDIFFFRMEMCAVGLHAQSMGGIDWFNVKGDLEEETLAVSIVSSGYYNDDAEDKDVLVYSGQGGGAGLQKGRQTSDQKLERGNLALDRSMRRSSQIRVIRGMSDGTTPGTKIYVYDGLYIIQESWIEKAESGAGTFKYKLVRMPGQADAFGLWKMVGKWKEDPSSRPGLILPDLTSGAETISVCLVNDFDNEKGPAYFTYCSTPKHSKAFGLLQTYGCGCQKGCAPGDLNCSCIRKNNGDLPYTTGGVLVIQKQLVYECSASCPCGPLCKNRVAQGGIKIRMEVFKTKNRGWGLRAYEPIRSGTFICEYAGDIIDKARLKQKVHEGENDEYIFDTSRVHEPVKWNYEPALLGEDGTDDSSEDPEVQPQLIISANDIGNVARFMNHSCEPNVFWQPVVWEEGGQAFLHIAFYALKHIPPMAELTYDYGVVPKDSDVGGAAYRKRKCLCGSSKCRGYFGL